MTDTLKKTNTACCESSASNPSGLEPHLQPLITNQKETFACCDSASIQQDAPFDRPGYALWHFVVDFPDSPSGPLPRIKTSLQPADIIGSIKTRFGIGRNNYKIAPGLYCAGNPGPDSPVLVTGNYKLSFDTLRKELTQINAWILVLNTNGVNVWCAAGKGTFSTREVAHRVKLTGLDKVVRHRKLILPQLSATGVSAHQVKKVCGFRVIWGPVRAKDIHHFLDSGLKADFAMRRVTFSLWERTVLAPVELSLLAKPSLWLLLTIILLSGIGPDIFSPGMAWQRGLTAAAAYGAGIIAGAVAVPILLPWIPGSAFFLKGIQTGLVAGAGIVLMFWDRIAGLEALILLLFTVVISSYLAMNFTGATPFTSPSGVEKEMRKAIPIQAGTLLVSACVWVAAAFIA